MKNSLFTFLSLFFLSINLFGQNWKPLNLTDKYNFQFQDSSYISHTIWVDSFDVVNGDSIFFLNRIVRDCDTCSLVWGIEKKLKNQGQFLQKRMLQQIDGSYHFEGERNFIIHTQKAIGEVWNFDILNNITAEISSKTESTVFSEMDSLMTISLSNGEQILLSKNHGFVEFPQLDSLKSFSLEGIEGRDLGEIVPDFWDLFDFEVGDIFQHKYSEAWSAFHKAEIFTKREILGKTVSGDTITYEVKAHRVYGTYDDNNGTWLYSQQGSNIEPWIFINDHAMYNGFNNEAIPTGDIEDVGCHFWEYDEVYFPQRHYKNNDGVVVKDVYPEGSISWYDGQLYFEDTLNTDILVPTFDCQYGFRFGEGIGLIYYDLWWFETTESEALLGYVKGQDTVGLIYPDSFFISNVFSIPKPNLEITIAPNPSNGQIQISFEKALKEDLQIEIFSPTGQLMSKNSMLRGTRQKMLDISYLPKGIFYIKLKGKESFGSSKLIRH